MRGRPATLRGLMRLILHTTPTQIRWSTNTHVGRQCGAASSPTAHILSDICPNHRVSQHDSRSDRDSEIVTGEFGAVVPRHLQIRPENGIEVVVGHRPKGFTSIAAQREQKNSVKRFHRLCCTSSEWITERTAQMVVLQRTPTQSAVRLVSINEAPMIAQNVEIAHPKRRRSVTMRGCLDDGLGRLDGLSQGRILHVPHRQGTV